MAATIAGWSLQLFCKCPLCREHVDLLDHSDFWEGKCHIAAVEHGTPATKELEVVCPDCGEYFEVDLAH